MMPATSSTVAADPVVTALDSEHSKTSWLPVEIIEHILDDLLFCSTVFPVTLSSIAKLSLISSDWVIPTRHKVFRSIRISDNNADELVQILRSPRCTIAPFMRELNLQSWRDGKQLSNILSALANAEVLLTTVSVSFLRCPKIGDLPRNDNLLALQALLKHAVSLTIDAWFCTESILMMACSCSELEKLSLSIEQPSETILQGSGFNGRLAKSIRELTLEHHGWEKSKAEPKTLIPWIAKQDLPNLSTLRLSRLEPCITALGGYFRDCGRSIVHLSLSLREKSFQLPDLIHIETLTCIIFWHFGAVITTLESIKRAPKLQKLTLDSRIPFRETIFLPDSRFRFNTLALNPGLSTVRLLHLKFCRRDLDPSTCNDPTVRSYLPQWDQNVILETEFEEPFSADNRYRQYHYPLPIFYRSRKQQGRKGWGFWSL